MKKNLLRIACMMLALLMLLPAVVSCSKKEEEKERETYAENELDVNSEEYKLKPADKDFGGYEFKILAQSNWLYGYHLTYDSEELGYPTSVVDKAVYERQEVIYNNYGIELVMVSVGGAASKLDTAFNAGDYMCDIVTLSGKESMTVAQKGQLYDINKLDGLNLEASYYDQNIQKQYRLGDRLFQIDGDFNYFDELRTASIAYNVDIYNVNKYDDKYGSLYDIVMEKEWTYDLMYEMYKDLGEDVNGDGKFNDADKYGMISETTFPHTILLGAGVFPVTNVNGDITIALEDTTVKQRTIDILQKVMPTVLEDSFLQYDKSGWTSSSQEADLATAGSDMFANGNALFRLCSLSAVTRLISADVNYGMLPVPMYYEDQESYYSECSAAYHYPASFANNMQPDLDTAVEAFEIFDYLSKYMPGEMVSLNEAFFETLSEFRLCKTPEDAEIMRLIFANKVYDADSALYLVNVKGITWDVVWNNKITTVASRLDKSIQDNKYAFLLLTMSLDENCPN